MADTVQLNDLVAEAADPAKVGPTPIFKVAKTKDGDATHRPQFEGAIDDAETFRVRAYIPEDFSKSTVKLTASDIRRNPKGKLDVVRSRDGRVNVTALEKDDVLVLMWTPVAYPTFSELTIQL